MTAPIVRFAQGAQTLNLNDGLRYSVDTGFTPPSVQIVPQIATGTSANRTGGGRRIGQRAVDRSWSWSLNVVGASDREVSRGALDVQAFLQRAGDPSEPLYLEFKANSDTPFQPLWGQDGWLRYEILHGSATIADEYITPSRRQGYIILNVELVIKPFAIGLRQQLGSALGGVLEDTIGTLDGISRGLIVPEATTNNFTNPVFGHATWNNGWTAGANILATQNVDKNFVLFGVNSAKLTSTGAANQFYQVLTLTAVTYTITFYVKAPDSSAITSTQVRAYFNSVSQIPTFTAIGNGWYRAEFSGTASAAAGNYGIIVLSPYTVYADGFQIELKTYATPLAYGDLLGNAWSGTAHASTSTRTAARARLAVGSDTFSNAQFTFGWIWKTARNSSDLGTVYFWDFGSTFHCRFDTGSNVYVFRDGTNQATSAAQVFSIGDTIIFHAVASAAGGLVLYVNGQSVATNVTYTPSALASFLYVGSDSGAVNQPGGTFTNFTILDVALTAAQVLADYNNLSKLTADDQRIGAIPWLWSSDGDDDVVNHDDSDANDDNWIVCGGIPGSAAAETYISMLPSVQLADIVLSNNIIEGGDFLTPDQFMFFDQSGVADATASGGAYKETLAVSTVELSLNTANDLSIRQSKLLAGKEAYVYVRLFDSGANLKIGYRITDGTVAPAAELRAITTVAAFRQFRTLPAVFSGASRHPRYLDDNPNYGDIQIRAVRTTGSAAVRLDYFAVMTRPLVVITVDASTGNILFDGRIARILPSSAPLNVIGDVFELWPEKYNLVTMFIASETLDTGIAATLTYSKVLVVPRWSLL